MEHFLPIANWIQAQIVLLSPSSSSQGEGSFLATLNRSISYLLSEGLI